jgi:hypothetical protein
MQRIAYIYSSEVWEQNKINIEIIKQLYLDVPASVHITE